MGSRTLVKGVHRQVRATLAALLVASQEAARIHCLG